jgi:hypothetical protein
VADSGPFVAHDATMHPYMNLATVVMSLRQAVASGRIGAGMRRLIGVGVVFIGVVASQRVLPSIVANCYRIAKRLVSQREASGPESNWHTSVCGLASSAGTRASASVRRWHIHSTADSTASQSAFRGRGATRAAASSRMRSIARNNSTYDRGATRRAMSSMLYRRAATSRRTVRRSPSRNTSTRMDANAARK